MWENLKGKKEIYLIIGVAVEDGVSEGVLFKEEAVLTFLELQIQRICQKSEDKSKGKQVTKITNTLKMKDNNRYYSYYDKYGHVDDKIWKLYIKLHPHKRKNKKKIILWSKNMRILRIVYMLMKNWII